jgi:hypothetical protein
LFTADKENAHHCCSAKPSCDKSDKKHKNQPLLKVLETDVFIMLKAQHNFCRMYITYYENIVELVLFWPKAQYNFSGISQFVHNALIFICSVVFFTKGVKCCASDLTFYSAWDIIVVYQSVM